MQALAAYGSDSGSDAESAGVSKVPRLARNAAPDVGVVEASLMPYDIQDITTKQITHNVPYAALSLPVQGPENPYSHRNPLQNGFAGHTEEFAIRDEDFDAQLRLFQSAQARNRLGQVEQSSVTGVPYIAPDSDFALKRGDNDDAARRKRKRKNKGDASVLDGDAAYKGPWAGFEDDDQLDTEPYIDDEVPVDKVVPPPDTDKTSTAAAAAPAAPVSIPAPDEETLANTKVKSKLITPGSERTTFHGKEMYDYQGRTYMSVPNVDDVDLRGEPGTQECFIPKRNIHTWRGHNKGVNVIRFFPNSGHLLLSGSMDTKVKLWDVYNERRCLRTYMGHNKAVRDLCFTNDGTKFITASYDKFLKLWDTETGKCISSFTTDKMPYCVKFNPDPDKQHLFLTGQADKKIYQFDINSGEIVQEYDQHLGAVNTITFVDNNRRFVTTSDDKTLRAWEFDIPVVIKYIAEPHMHSMPSVAISPNKKWLACQSLDNQIMVYGAGDRFRMNRKKSFRGHLIAGYACQVNFSADGRFVMSGDSEGKINFWDWKTCKLLKKFQAHEGVVMGCEWHPHETSKIATCSWDGTIKYWD
ncbi:hypothetical protein RI367_001155 [Sorochytrium milnesiophthora]